MMLGRINHEILKGYRGLSEAGNTTNLLGSKVRELIALVVAVTRQCNGCIITHTDAAIKQGASREEIVEALGVAIAVDAGAALTEVLNITLLHIIRDVQTIFV